MATSSINKQTQCVICRICFKNCSYNCLWIIHQLFYFLYKNMTPPHRKCAAKVLRHKEMLKCDTETVKVKSKMGSTRGENEVIRLVTQDQIRELIVRRPVPALTPMIIDKEDMKVLKNQSTVITTKDRLKMLEKEEAQKNLELEESNARKEEIRRHVKKTEKGTKLTEVDSEAKKRAQHLLQRAFDMRQEQEEEVKHANRIILGTKCHAIRDAQIAEKKLIREEMMQEESRLDEMMEQERQRLLREQRSKKEHAEACQKRYVQHILEQINEHELDKLQQAERIREESWLMNKAQAHMMQQELEEQTKKAEQQHKMREELRQINEQLLYFKQLEEEEQRVEDLKVQQYMQQKAERELAREEELKLQRLAREKEIARLRMLQQRQQDLQAEIDEISAQRIQDEVEREWRRKQKEAVQKKRQQEEEMKKAREAQIKGLRHMQALENAALRKEHESVLQAQSKAAEKFCIEQEKKKKEVESYRTAILEQINEKESERIRKRQEVFAEGEALKTEQKMHQKHTNEIMKKKVDELRLHKVPDEYIKEIERRLNLVP